MKYNAQMRRNESATRRLPVPVEIPTVPRRPIVQQTDFLLDLHNHSYLPSCWTNPINEKPPLDSNRFRAIEKPITTTPRKGSMPKSYSSESEDEQLTVVSRLEKFSKGTTAHGIPRISSSKSCCGKLCWSFVILVCLFMFMTQTYLLVVKFQRSQQIVKTKSIYEPPLFPAVTVCSLNPFRRSLAREIPKIRRTLETFEKAPFGSTKRHQAKEKLIIALASLPEEERVLLSNEKLDFIELCSFNGRDCTIENDFKLTIDPVFGNCYTFNADASRNLSSTKHGSAFGLIMQLNMQTDDFIRTSETAGFRISIHRKSHYPFPDSNGYSASVGFLTSFGIKQRITHSLPRPHNNCTKNGKNEKYIYPEYDYQIEGCQRSCIQRALMDICTCADPRLPTPANAKHCTIQNDAYIRECLKTTMYKMGDLRLNPRILNGCEKECQRPCDQEMFDVAVSMAQWPANPLNMDNCYDPNPGECFKHYKLHAALVEVYYQQLSYEELIEREAHGKCPFRLADLIADFGGLLGFWLGISLMTGLEILVLLWDLFVMTVIRRKKNSDVASRTDFQTKSASKDAFDRDPIHFTRTDMQLSAF